MTDKEILFYISACLGMHRNDVSKLKELSLLNEALFDTEPEVLAENGIPDRFLYGLSNIAKAARAVEKKKKLCSAEAIRFLTPEDPEWPVRFFSMPDPPLWVYARGTLPGTDVPTVSVIGSRAATTYGLRMAEFISGELGRKGVCIVSGLAVGIDGTAQKAALDCGGRSLAVLGCGINVCYPKENFELFNRLLSVPGCGIISEFPPGSPSSAWHFPDRNRLIAALGDCLAVCEARGPKSGSMITVEAALSQGKEIFAVPGRITDPLSRGCNDLIQNGAALLSGPDDILDFIGLSRSGLLPPQASDPKMLDEDERKLYDLIKEEPRFLDTLIQKTGLTPGKIMSILLKLELKGMIIQPSGNYYAAVLKSRRRRQTAGPVTPDPLSV